MAQIKPDMELRKLGYNHCYQLSKILDNNNSWKSLMEEIPRDLSEMRNQNNYNRLFRKYSAENIQQIEDASKRNNKSATEILFNEWGTSGRVRATVGDLLELLKKVQLYRAADFVAVKILGTDPPARPARGPAACIDITLPEEEIEGFLDRVPYPNTSVLTPDIDSNINNINHNLNRLVVDPVKNINLTQNSDQSTNSHTSRDLMEFSATSVSDSNNETSLSHQRLSSIPETVFSSDATEVVSTTDGNMNESEGNVNFPDFKQLQNGNQSSFQSTIHSRSNVESMQSETTMDSNNADIPASGSQFHANSVDSQNVPNLSILNGASLDVGSDS